MSEMNLTGFNEGDRVVINLNRTSKLNGMTGTITRLVYWNREAFVDFDDKETLFSMYGTKVAQLFATDKLEKV